MRLPGEQFVISSCTTIVHNSHSITMTVSGFREEVCTQKLTNYLLSQRISISDKSAPQYRKLSKLYCNINFSTQHERYVCIHLHMQWRNRIHFYGNFSILHQTVNLIVFDGISFYGENQSSEFNMSIVNDYIFVNNPIHSNCS